MFCKVSKIFTYILLFVFFFLIFFISQPLVVKYGINVSAETLIARKIDFLTMSKPFLPYVSVNLNKNERCLQYEEGIKIFLVVEGKKKTVYSEVCDVAAFLTNEGIILSEYDEVSLPLHHILSDCETIWVKRIKYKTYELDIPIKYNIVREYNSLVEDGVIVVWTPGENGILRKKIKERYEDGELKKTELLWQKEIKAPVTEVIAIGTAKFSGPYVKKYRMLASSYTPTVEECDSDPFTTASGRRVRYGIVAVDPKVIPLGTKLYVSGYGYAIAADTGGLIKGMRIDCFFWRRLKDSNWRGGYIDVYVLE